MRQKLLIIIITITSLINAANISMWAQVKSTNSRDSLTVDERQLQAASLNYKISEFEKNKKVYYRLRIGPFYDSASASVVCSFFAYKQYWLVADSSANLEKYKVENTDSISSSNKRVSFLNVDSFVIIYMENFGLEMSRLPSDAIVYLINNDSKRKVELKNITGISTNGDSVLFGKAVHVFTNFDNTDHSLFEKEINDFSKREKIDLNTIKKHIVYFNDSQDAYYVKGSVFTFRDTAIKTSSSSFDYIDENNLPRKYTGDLSNKPIGNQRLIQITDGATVGVFDKKRSTCCLMKKNDQNCYFIIMKRYL